MAATAVRIGVETTRTRELLNRYAAECPVFWAGQADRRQCAKLWRHFALIERQFGLAREEAIDRVLAHGGERVANRPATVYVSGRGGSGSHWLAEMLGDLGAFADAGEVSIPGGLARELAPWPIEEQSLFIDCLHMLHAWAGQPYENLEVRPHHDIADLHIVNSNGDSKPLRAKLIEPHCVFIHLVRDPRDQVLSFTYRKPGAHQNYPVKPLEDFLRLMLIFNRVSMHKALAAPVGPDLVIRYEDLRHSATPALSEIVERVGADVSRAAIEDVAFRHSAAARRQGLAPLGNLSVRPSKNWQTLASTPEKLLMHAGLTEVVDTLGYELDDCRGEPLEFAPLAREHTIELPDELVLGELHFRRGPDDGWERDGHASGTFTVPAGVMVRLRASGGWTVGLERIDELLPPGALSSLCVAGNREVTDAFVERLRRFSGLLELDLARTLVTDGCVGTLTEMTDLRHLSVVGTALTADGVARLRQALPHCDVSTAPLINDSMRGRGFFNEELITDPPS